MTSILFKRKLTEHKFCSKHDHFSSNSTLLAHLMSCESHVCLNGMPAILPRRLHQFNLLTYEYRICIDMVNKFELYKQWWSKIVTLLPFYKDGILMNCVLLWAWSKFFYIANFSFLRLKRSNRLVILLREIDNFEAKHCEFVMFCEKFVTQFIRPRTTDAQTENSLHCTAENPIPNF